MNEKSNRPLRRSLAWLTVAVAGLLLLPLVAMHYSEAVFWTAGDFVAGGVLLFSAGLAFILLTRRPGARRHQVLIACTVALVFAYIWAELAVGVFTNLGS